MKLTIARNEHECGICSEIIPAKAKFYYSPNMDLCAVCYPKWKSGQLRYVHKYKTYIDVNDLSNEDLRKTQDDTL